MDFHRNGEKYVKKNLQILGENEKKNNKLKRN